MSVNKNEKKCTENVRNVFSLHPISGKRHAELSGFAFYLCISGKKRIQRALLFEINCAE